MLRAFLESKGENVPAPMRTSLPYRLEPNHLGAGEIEAEDGMDAAY